VNPGTVQYPIPANDDGVSALKLMIDQAVDAIRDGIAERGTRIATAAAAKE
jgi:ribosomal protein S2